MVLNCYKNILVVEDEMLIAIDLEDLLADAGYNVIGPASTLEEAIDFAKNVKIDYALLDLKLVNSNVLPLARILAESNIAFMFFSGADQARDLPVEFKKYDFIQKPVEQIEILERVASYFRKSDIEIREPS